MSPNRDWHHNSFHLRFHGANRCSGGPCDAMCIMSASFLWGVKIWLEWKWKTTTHNEPLEMWDYVVQYIFLWTCVCPDWVVSQRCASPSASVVFMIATFPSDFWFLTLTAVTPTPGRMIVFDDVWLSVQSPHLSFSTQPGRFFRGNSPRFRWGQQCSFSLDSLWLHIQQKVPVGYAWPRARRISLFHYKPCKSMTTQLPGLGCTQMSARICLLKSWCGRKNKDSL